jgi:hypothetical protein
LSTIKDLERILKPWFNSEERKALIALVVESLSGVSGAFSLDELSDVSIPTTPSTGALLYYKGSPAEWGQTPTGLYDAGTDTLTVTNLNVTNVEVDGGGTIEAPGSDKQIIYNSGGVLTGTADFTYGAVNAGFLDVGGINTAALVYGDVSVVAGYPYVELVNSDTLASNRMLFGVQNTSTYGLGLEIRATTATNVSNVSLFSTNDPHASQGSGVLKVGAAASDPSGVPTNATYVFHGTPDILGDPAREGLYSLDENGVFKRLSGPNIPESSWDGISSYTINGDDQGCHLLHTSGTPHTIVIPANAGTPLPIGTAVTIVNGNGAGALTIQCTSDTMRLAGTGATGDRTLAANGIATVLKIAATEWIISGTGLT